MTIQMTGPRRIARPRRTVLLTGASGVVGRALLRRLRDVDVVCLVHRSPVSGPNVTTVPGDVAEPVLGLAERAYAELAARVDAVDPCWPIDFVPADVVADAIACVVENRVSEGEFWLSAGDRALRLDEAVAVAVEFGRGLGVSVDVPRFVPPEMFDRLIGPVFLDALPGKIRRNVLRMLEFFTTYLQSGQTKPSSLDQLVALGARPLPDQRESLRNSLRYWAARSGYGPAQTQKAA
jgi:NAD(P)-dependent dehydrogenase (short-subunit alcohol dehydrogenase family)